MKVFDGKNGRVVVEFNKEVFSELSPLFIRESDIKDLKRINELSDGYLTFDELYEFRKMYNSVIFNEWALENPYQTEARIGHNETFNDNQQYVPKYNVHKSWRHNDGELCFGGGWFIVSAMLPTGLISNHYKAEDWDLFQVPEVEKALYEI